MPRNRLYRIRKTHSCNYDPAGPHILANTIGNAIAGGIEGSQDTSAQGQGGGGGSSFNGPISNMGNFSLPGGITSFDLVPPETQIQGAVDGGVISSDVGASALAALEQIKTNLRDSYAASQSWGASGYQTLTDGGNVIDHATLDARQANVNGFLASNPNANDQSLSSAGFANNSALIDQWDGIAGQQVNMLFGGFLGGTALLGAAAATAPVWAPALAELGGYEGSAGTMAQAAVIKAGIGLTIELGGNYATNSQTTIGGLTGTVLASTLVAPGIVNSYGLGAKGLAIAGLAGGFTSHFVTQGVDFANGGRSDLSLGELALSTGFGLAGGVLAAPLQKFAAPASLLFRNWSPLVDELFNAPTTASGAATDVAKKVLANQPSGG